MFWIDAPGAGRLAIAARPRSGDWLEDEIEGWRSASVDVLSEADSINSRFVPLARIPARSMASPR